MELDVLGLKEVAALVDRNTVTVRSWYQRGHLPEPDALLSCGPIWRRTTISRWTRSPDGKLRLAT
jgi:hypothetical protein